MKTTQTQHDDVGGFIEVDGSKYRPLITSRFSEGQTVSFEAPPKHADDATATVGADGVTETWTADA